MRVTEVKAAPCFTFQHPLPEPRAPAGLSRLSPVRVSPRHLADTERVSRSAASHRAGIGIGEWRLLCFRKQNVCLQGFYGLDIFRGIRFDKHLLTLQSRLIQIMLTGLSLLEVKTRSAVKYLGDTFLLPDGCPVDDPLVQRWASDKDAMLILLVIIIADFTSSAWRPGGVTPCAALTGESAITSLCAQITE